MEEWGGWCGLGRGGDGGGGGWWGWWWGGEAVSMFTDFVAVTYTHAHSCPQLVAVTRRSHLNFCFVF